MKTSIECPHCGKRYTVGEETLGKSVKCRECGNAFAVTFAVDAPSLVQPESTPEQDSFSINTSSAKQQLSSNRRHVSGFVDAFFALFDWRFQRYLTPWVVRVTWVVFLALVVMWLLTLCLGVIVSILPFDPPAPANREFGQFTQPQSSGLSLFARYIAGLVTMVTLSLLGVLWVRVTLELIIVRFNMAESLRSLENASTAKLES